MLNKGVFVMKRMVLSCIVIVSTLIYVVMMLYINGMIPEVSRNTNRGIEEIITKSKLKDKEYKENKDVGPQMSLAEDNRQPEKKISSQNSEILKVSIENFKKDIDDLDRAKLNLLSSKISPIDYARINNYLKENNDMQGLYKTIGLLRIRLGKNDYEKFKEIADKYINIDKVEKIYTN
jgi:hypothetical protein